MTRRIFLLALTCLALLAARSPAKASEGVANIILFYDPNSSACKQVISDLLPPLLNQYDKRLNFLFIDVSKEKGKDLYQSAIQSFSIPENRQLVPLVLAGDQVLSGYDEINSQLASLVREAVQSGGSTWPEFPGLQSELQAHGVLPGPNDAWHKFLNNQPLNSVAVLVLLLLSLSLVYSILTALGIIHDGFQSAPVWLMPALVVIGLGIAVYLSYTEISPDAKAYCGGWFSGCQEVEVSQYSRLLGILPVGLFGVIGDLSIGAAWIIHRFAKGSWKAIVAIVMYGLAIFAVSFSIYLTFLEPFLIGSTCVYCLGSALVLSLILPLTTNPVREAIRQYGQVQKENPLPGR